MKAAAITTAPMRWIDERPLPYRACEICAHRRARTYATAPLLCGYVEPGHTRALPIAVDRARASGGHCGPEAEHLSFPGLQG